MLSFALVDLIEGQDLAWCHLSQPILAAPLASQARLPFSELSPFRRCPLVRRSCCGLLFLVIDGFLGLLDGKDLAGIYFFETDALMSLGQRLPFLDGRSLSRFVDSGCVTIYCLGLRTAWVHSRGSLRLLGLLPLESTL